MKKVKIMLMSALVIAAVGGALAFKAQTYSKQSLRCGTTVDSCPDLTNIYTTTDGAFLEEVFCTTPAGNTAVCDLTVTDSEG